MSAQNNTAKLVTYITKKQQAGEIVSVRQAAQYLRSSAAVAAEALDLAEATGAAEYTIFEVDGNRYYFLTNVQDLDQAPLLLPALPAEDKRDPELLAAIWINAVTFPDAFSPAESVEGYEHLMRLYDAYAENFAGTELGKTNTNIPTIWERTVNSFKTSYALATAKAGTVEPSEELPLAEDELPSASEMVEANVENQPKFVPESVGAEETAARQLSFADLPEADMDMVAAINKIEPVALEVEAVCPLCSKKIKAGSVVIRGLGPACLKQLARYSGIPENELSDPSIILDDRFAELVEEFKNNEKRPQYKTMEEALAAHPEGLVSLQTLYADAPKYGIPSNRVVVAAGGGKGLGEPLNENWRMILVAGKKRFFSANAQLSDLVKKETAETK